MCIEEFVRSVWEEWTNWKECSRKWGHVEVLGIQVMYDLVSHWKDANFQSAWTELLYNGFIHLFLIFKTSLWSAILHIIKFIYFKGIIQWVLVINVSGYAAFTLVWFWNVFTLQSYPSCLFTINPVSIPSHRDPLVSFCLYRFAFSLNWIIQYMKSLVSCFFYLV